MMARTKEQQREYMRNWRARRRRKLGLPDPVPREQLTDEQRLERKRTRVREAMRVRRAEQRRKLGLPEPGHRYDDVPLSRRAAVCAGDCGAVLQGKKTSLPPGQRMCLSCRARGLAPVKPRRVCERKGCDRTHWARGLCLGHYKKRAEKLQRARDLRLAAAGLGPVKQMVGALREDGRAAAVITERMRPGGVLVWCTCGACTGVVDPDRRWMRVCLACDSQYWLNEFELAFAESEQQVA